MIPGDRTNPSERQRHGRVVARVRQRPVVQRQTVGDDTLLARAARLHRQAVESGRLHRHEPVARRRAARATRSARDQERQQSGRAHASLQVVRRASRRLDQSGRQEAMRDRRRQVARRARLGSCLSQEEHAQVAHFLQGYTPFGCCYCCCCCDTT